MPSPPKWPANWPTNPNLIPIPPVPTTIPTALAELELAELAGMYAILRLACGRSTQPLKEPGRKLLCVLAAIIDYEIYKREHH